MFIKNPFDPEAFFNSLIGELKKDLPGEYYQNKMAPSVRGIKKIHHSGPKKSSVLILLYPSPASISTVLIKRTDYNGVHSGQVSFPGGKHEEPDPDLIHTAFRETKEEIGVSPKNIDFLGTLTPLYIPVSNINVLPVVGKINTSPSFHINEREVKYVIELSLDDLLSPQSIRSKIMDIHGGKVLVPYYHINNEEIWGATAMILSEFLEIIKKIASIPL